jgi:hypothetical protein
MCLKLLWLKKVEMYIVQYIVQYNMRSIFMLFVHYQRASLPVSFISALGDFSTFYIFWRARVCWPLLCLCRLRFLRGVWIRTQRACRDKQVRYTNFATHPSKILVQYRYLYPLYQLVASCTASGNYKYYSAFDICYG